MKFKDVTSAQKAIACYKEAGVYWNEKEASYDWALLKKNIAETKYALGKITRDIDLLLQALQESIESTRYRTIENSPYQWGRSIRIAFSVVITLHEMSSVQRITKAIRKTIRRSCDIILSDENSWLENLSDQFVQSTKDAQRLIKGID